MVHCQNPKYLANHTQKISACTDLQCSVLSWMIACAQQETCLCSPQLGGKMLPQSERCLLQVLFMDVEVFTDLREDWIAACI